MAQVQHKLRCQVGWKQAYNKALEWHKVPGLDDLGTLRDELKHHAISLCQDIDINGATVA